jgi:hypothetical protein
VQRLFCQRYEKSKIFFIKTSWNGQIFGNSVDKSFTMKNKTNSLTEGKTTAINKLQISAALPGTEALIVPLPVQKRLTSPPKDFPINKWTMPIEPHGYIQGHDNDCL